MTSAVQIAAERTPVRASQVLGAGLAVLALALAVVMLLRKPLEARDAAQELGTHFAPGALPFDFQLSEAYELSGKDVVVLLTRDDPREEAETSAELDEDVGSSPEEEGDAEQDEQDEAEDEEEWTVAIHERHALEDGTPPSLVYLVRYPADNVKSVLAKQFARRSLDGGGRGGTTRLTVDGGRLRWGEYDADFVLERAYAEGGHFADVVRVNLTHGKECWILFALWPRDYRASNEPVERLLEALPPA